MTDARPATTARRPSIDRRRAGRWTLGAAGAFAFLHILTPLIFAPWLSFYAQEIPSYPPEGCSLRWYDAATRNDRFIDAFLVSFQLGVISTVIGLAVALPAAIGITRLRFRGVGALGNLLLLPLIVPGIFLGLAI